MHEREQGYPQSNARRNRLSAVRPSHALARAMGTSASYRLGSAVPLVGKIRMDEPVAGCRRCCDLLDPRSRPLGRCAAQEKKTRCKLFGRLTVLHLTKRWS